MVKYASRPTIPDKGSQARATHNSHYITTPQRPIEQTYSATSESPTALPLVYTVLHIYIIVTYIIIRVLKLKCNYHTTRDLYIIMSLTPYIGDSIQTYYTYRVSVHTLGTLHLHKTKIIIHIIMCIIRQFNTSFYFLFCRKWYARLKKYNISTFMVFVYITDNITKLCTRIAKLEWCLEENEKA